MKHKRRFRKNDLELTLLGLPTVIWYLFFCFLPMFGIIIAFKKFTFQPGHGFLYNLLTSPWSGLANFEFLFKSKDAWIIFRNTIGYNFIFVVLGVFVPASLAIMINQLHSKRLAKITQTVMFLPYFMSWVVVTYLVSAFLSYDVGLFNRMLQSMGMKSVQWYMESKYWPYFLIFLNLWKSMGYAMVIYLASLTSIDGTLYEAAVIDGASQWQQIRYITVPILKTTMVMMFLLNIGRIFYSDFGLFYQVPRASASLYKVTETMDVYIYRALSGSVDISRPSAAAFIQSVAGCATILTANWIVRKVDRDSAIL
jgi:putative aldouronate transport system permease protein